MERMKRTLSIAAIAGLLISTSAMAETGQAQPSMPSGHGESKESQSKALDMTKTQDPTPSEYAILPLARGQKKMVGDHNLLGGDVKGKDGKSLGSLEQLIMDTKTNKIAYGVVHFSDTNEMWPLHWKSFKVNEESGEVSLNLTREQLRSRSSLDDAKDLSPDVKKMVKDMQKNMGNSAASPEDSNRGKAGINSGGQVIAPDAGEQAGKPGTIFGGPATLPPGEAPGYEGADKGHKGQTN